VSLAASQTRTGAQSCVSTPLDESLSRIQIALASISWQYLAALWRHTPKRPSFSRCVRSTAVDDAALSDGKRIGVCAAGEVGCCAPCLTDHFFFLP
jgi:hypothetical protein